MYQHSRRRQLTVLAALLAASIVCITIDFRQPDGGPVDRLQRLAIAAFGPLQRGASAVVRPVAGLAGEVAELGGLRDDNRRLEAEVARLRAQERTHADVLGENRRLRGALSARCGTLAQPVPSTARQAKRGRSVASVRAHSVPRGHRGRGRCGSGLVRAPVYLRETDLDQFLYERLRQGAVDGEVQGALGHRVAVELVGKL